ncbi:hypothetical protein TNCV_3738331 [Trichonephila clavipes]|nr:hypothetical protein TNCV_3738331 [Trichonephila clavipes]
MVNLPWRDPRFTNDIGIFKRAESIEFNEHVRRPSTSRDAENVLLVSECVRKDRRQTLEQIVEVTHFSKTSFEGIHRHKQPQCWQSDDWYLLHDNAPTHRSQLGRRFVSSDEIKVGSQMFLREVAKIGFQLCFQKLYERWNKCIVA